MVKDLCKKLESDYNILRYVYGFSFEPNTKRKSAFKFVTEVLDDLNKFYENPYNYLEVARLIEQIEGGIKVMVRGEDLPENWFARGNIRTEKDERRARRLDAILNPAA